MFPECAKFTIFGIAVGNLCKTNGLSLLEYFISQKGFQNQGRIQLIFSVLSTNDSGHA